MRLLRHFALGCLVAVIAPAQAATAESGDAQSRRALLERFAERFSGEIFPLFHRQANGCVACHHAQSPQQFRVLDSPRATFSLLLEHGLLNAEDPMAIPGRITSADADLMMPMAGELAPEEISRIRQFATDLGDALGPDRTGGSHAASERFPDALLLPYDGPDRDRAVRRAMSYYQLRRSFSALFGSEWLEASGPDPFERKASRFGGADFRASFDTSRTVSASYLATLQEVAREVSRRFVSAPRAARFEGFDPEVYVSRSRKRAERNVTALYQRILFESPSADEIERALSLVEGLQAQPETERTVRFWLEATDANGRSDRRAVDALVGETAASVSRFEIDQNRPAPGDDPWVRVGNTPFRFEKGNPEHFVRVVARPGNHVTAFDAVRLRRVVGDRESGEAIVLDNQDPECVLAGSWEPVEKDGERSRAGPPKKKYEQDLHVVGSNHVESRTLENVISHATMALRIPSSGKYNVYLSWPAIPRAAKAATVEVRSATSLDAARPADFDGPEQLGFARIRVGRCSSQMNQITSRSATSESIRPSTSSRLTR